MRMRHPPQDAAGSRLEPVDPVDPVDPDDRYRPLPRRRRLLVALLAVVTAVVAIVELTSRWGLVGHSRRHRPDVPACAPGQTSGCVGSKTEVLVAKPPPPPPAPVPAR